MIAALLLVQFVGIPYSLIFGRLPSKKEKRRPFYLAFVLYNIVALPLVGITGTKLLASDVTGASPPAFANTASAVGEGVYLATGESLTYAGTWETTEIPAEKLGGEQDANYRFTTETDSRLEFTFNGQDLQIIHSTGPGHGIWAVELDGQPLVDETTGKPLRLDAYHPTERYGVTAQIQARESGEHTLVLINRGDRNPNSSGTSLGITQIEVEPPLRQSNLPFIIGLIFAVQGVGLLLAFLLGKPLFSKFADTIDTRRGILIGLSIYVIIAVWGYFIDSVFEFWFLAWMVAVVQGGSQALSRSLFSSMSPASKSGEFFGLFGIMEKFSAIVGPLVFAWAATTFGSSRPAVLSIVVFFLLGGYLLTRVDVEEGRRVAKEEDAALLELNQT